MKTNNVLVTYVAIPIKHCHRSHIVQRALEEEGIVVKAPWNLIEPDLPKEKIPGFYAESCYEMIESADFLILYSDYYGRDCAAEIGYAIKSQKPVFPFSLEGKDSEYIEQDFMINAKVEPLSKSLEELIRRISSHFVGRQNETLQNSITHEFVISGDDM